MHRFALVVFVLLAWTTRSEAQTTVWVDAAEGSDGGEGTSIDEFATISRGVEEALTIGGTFIIKVREGDYTQAHELAGGALVKGYPITLENNITIEGDETAEIDFPRIGGDIDDSDTRALFLVDATIEGRANIEVRNLNFVAEDTNSDAPSAFLLTVADGREVQNVSFVGNVCSRPAQNTSGSNGRATVVVTAAPGELTNINITDNKIQASDRGGIEIILDAQSEETVGIGGQLARNTITMPSGESALFGIRWVSEGDSSATFLGLGAGISDNKVLGTGGYLTTGIEVRCFEGTTAGHMGAFAGNEVRDCVGDGVVLRADGVEGTGDDTEISFNGGATRNVIVGNGGSGVLLWWDEVDHQDGAGSIHFRLEGNVIADNGDYGVVLRGLGPESQGGFGLVNDTIADNLDGGLRFELTLGSSLPVIVESMRNVIVYGNGDADQVSGLGSTMLAQMFALVHYSNWSGIPSLSNGNIDDDPELDSEYHISVTSPSVDKARVAGVTASVDIDGEDRVQDGNGDETAVIDQGADEVPAAEE